MADETETELPSPIDPRIARATERLRKKLGIEGETEKPSTSEGELEFPKLAIDRQGPHGYPTGEINIKGPNQAVPQHSEPKTVDTSVTGGRTEEARRARDRSRMGQFGPKRF